VILMPLGCIAGLSPLQIEALLAHELAHIRRHDYLVNACQSLVETLLFYHPAVWWVSKQVRNEREHCCDDIAVGVTGNSLAYAKALSFLEEQRSLVPAVSLGANGGHLKTRIQRLLGCDPAPAVSRPAALTLFALAIAAAALYAGSVARAQTDAGRRAAIESRESSPAIPLVYRKWVNEDVRWIITPAERAAFLKLTDNTERDEFVRQFWERRNPAGENTFKEQYYRRIAYSNRHFGAANIPGWLSDRGRVYIVYGPPTGIDAHPSAAAGSSKPSEIWHYRLLRETGLPPLGNPASGPRTTTVAVTKNVDMRFVDVCSCGDYRLQPGPN
jgi:GWxTD domain-containing protein